MTALTTSELRELHAKAGPFNEEGWIEMMRIVVEHDAAHGKGRTRDAAVAWLFDWPPDHVRQDAAFVVAAKDSLPALLDRIEQLEEAQTELRTALKAAVARLKLTADPQDEDDPTNDIVQYCEKVIEDRT